MDEFDEACLKWETGIGAVWLLYIWRQWGYLEDFGLERAKVERLFEKFDDEEAPGSRLTWQQCRKLAKAIPSVEVAGRELRHAYGMLYYDQAKAYGHLLVR